LSRLGVGGILPKEFENGSFMKRGLTSSDKLLEQLIGKKKAKAHLASKLQATRLGSRPQPKQGRREAVKKDESEDEEEGRGSAFQSKKRRVVKPKQTAVKDEGDADEEHEMEGTIADPLVKDEEDVEVSEVKKEEEEVDVIPVATSKKSIPSRGRAKPVSYLDELLAERSKKKKNKTKNKTAEET
jgi:hypothetical protein